MLEIEFGFGFGWGVKPRADFAEQPHPPAGKQWVTTNGGADYVTYMGEMVYVTA
ncbi:hypothetical protein [Brevundimonas diminuta]|uniref:hypothetical protein n=1 Tax=Brevundimonas diminuta TaxID=293 RepID=UPI001376A8AD|nr:hypothetical protein [Brevundimonas diminuta]